MNKLITGAILIGALLLGGEAFPRQLTPMQNLPARSAKALAEQPSTRATAADIIYEAPEGVHKSFYRNGTTYYLDNWGMPLPLADDQYVIGDVVEGDDGFVYFRNPVMGVPANSYMKGIKEGDEIVFSLPQPMMDWDGVVIGVAVIQVTGENSFGPAGELAKEIDEVRFKINPDGSYTQLTAEDQLLGYYYTDDNSWTSYGTPQQTYYPFEATTPPFPGNADIKEGQLIFKNNGRKVKFAIADDKFYIADIYPVENGGCAVGTIEGDKVTFDSYQFLGASEEVCHYIFFAGANIDDLQADTESTGYKTITFKFDAESSTLTYSREGDIILANASAKDIYYLEYFENPKISPFILAPATPIPPVISTFEELWYMGFAYTDFTLPLLSTDGNLLDPDYYYYSFYIDDEIMEFYPDEYYDLTDVVTEMPYGYTDGYSIVIIDGMHEVAFYSEVTESFGIQGVYIVDGETHRSEITYAKSSGVKAVVDNNLPVVSEEYYDLTGRSIETPANGIVIKKSTFSDGSSKAEKIVMKHQF